MVRPELITAIQSVLGSEARNILVTGASGFVGANIARALAVVGHHVTATGRNHYLGPRGIKFARVDVRNVDAMVELCRHQDIVVHAAADGSIAKTYDQLEAVNVGGTENVIRGCLEHHVQRLIHISSTSVFFRAQDDYGIADDRPIGESFFCGYAKSKAVAEQRVQEACQKGLNAFLIRARAVFGPGDNNLVPRVLQASDRGRMRQIGDGKNVTDLTHVDNLVYAVALAMEKGDSGAVCTITGGEPILLWPLMKRILEAAGRPHELKSVSYSTAYRIAAIGEKLSAVFGNGEPTLTRYSVGLLGKSQTFSPAAAETQLGYQPIVAQNVAVEETLADLASKDDSHADQAVTVRWFSTGYTMNREFAAEQGGAWGKRMRFHAMVGLITHPEHGVTLLDTGYSPRFHEASAKWPYSLYAKVTPCVADVEQSAVATLERMGIRKEDVKRIIISHFHGDHICGLKDFPHADVISTTEAWQSIRTPRGYLKGLKAVKYAFLPLLMPEDLTERIFPLGHFHDPGIGPFDKCHDLFGDGSVRVISLPGHAFGQIGALIQTGPSTRVLWVADAVLTRKTIEENLSLTMACNLLAADKKAAEVTRKKLVEFHHLYPDVEIVPTHCPKTLAQA